MPTLEFSAFQLIEEQVQKGSRYISPTFDSFSKLPEAIRYSKDKTHYEGIAEKNQDDNYIWLEFKYGNSSPRSPYAADPKTGDKQDNPLPKGHYVPTKQLFCIYSIEEEIIYLSNSKSLSLIQNILSLETGRAFIIKSIFKNMDEFINIVKSVDEISFSNINDIFGRNAKQRSALKDLVGDETPERMSIRAEYTGEFLPIKLLRQLFSAKQEHNLSRLVIRGKDESGLGLIFNTESFRHKVKVDYTKNEDDMIESNSVKYNIIQHLKGKQ